MTERHIKKYVLDASVAIKWFNQKNEKHLEKARAFLQLIKKQKIKVIAPELIILEFFNALIKSKKLSPFDLYQIHQTFFKLAIEFKTLNKDLTRLTLTIATKYNLTSYDSIYVALAIKNKAILITDNPKCFNKVKENFVINLQDFCK